MTDTTEKWLALAAVAEAATGLALLLAPAFVARLLLGPDDLTGIAVVLARVTGISLIALGLSCWPGDTALAGMLTYSGGVTLYLTLVGLAGEFVGVLLWPAVILHTVLTALLTWAWRKRHTIPPSRI
ncbi:MAG: hypothetical protein WBJ41_13340 [Chromatiaceae bacterium]